MVGVAGRYPFLYQQDTSLFTLLGHTPVTLGVQMATIRKRLTNKGTKYQVQIRKKGHKPTTKSFVSYVPRQLQLDRLA